MARRFWLTGLILALTLKIIHSRELSTAFDAGFICCESMAPCKGGWTTRGVREMMLTKVLRAPMYRCVDGAGCGNASLFLFQLFFRVFCREIERKHIEIC